jgi:hypothetical protein
MKIETGIRSYYSVIRKLTFLFTVHIFFNSKLLAVCSAYILYFSLFEIACLFAMYIFLYLSLFEIAYLVAMQIFIFFFTYDVQFFGISVPSHQLSVRHMSQPFRYKPYLEVRNTVMAFFPPSNHSSLYSQTIIVVCTL